MFLISAMHNPSPSVKLASWTPPDNIYFGKLIDYMTFVTVHGCWDNFTGINKVCLIAQEGVSIFTIFNFRSKS